MLYSPAAVVAAVFAIPVDTEVTVTVAPEMTAPEWSVTVPMIAVSTVCAWSGAQSTASETKSRNRELGLRKTGLLEKVTTPESGRKENVAFVELAMSIAPAESKSISDSHLHGVDFHRVRCGFSGELTTDAADHGIDAL